MPFKIDSKARDGSIEAREKARRNPDWMYVQSAKVKLLENHLAEADIKNGKFKLLSDEAPDIGGENKGPQPLDYMLAGIALCEGAQLIYNAIDMGITFDSAEVSIKAYLPMGAWAGVMPMKGWDHVDIETKVTGPGREKLIDWARTAEKRCPAYNSLVNPVRVNSKLIVNGEEVRGEELLSQK